MTDDRSIERLAYGTLDHSLPRAEWTHAAHFAVSLWLLRHRRERTTPAAMRMLITGYNEATGTANTDSGGYHHTITVASMAVADAHLRGCGPDMPLHRVFDTLMASRLGRSDWLLDHWRRDTLFAVAARRGWVEPDLAPLPFRKGIDRM